MEPDIFLCEVFKEYLSLVELQAQGNAMGE